ncbi:MAG: Glu/Leu/Phe/Val dehydrogenase dimerization domain-containing protein [Planktothrix sp. GU0601_MAG3]|nr:MAG: Glu/Leu/Phe/Val dehydrogenase dimerization domain-containing protein [Planktothrix sp. GU0601_MAG3]
MVSSPVRINPAPTPAYICPYDRTCSYLGQAAVELDLDDNVLVVLQQPRKVITVSIPVKLDNGKVEVLAGHRVQHCDVLGPYKGGLRYHPSVNLGETLRPSDVNDLEMRFIGNSLRGC